MLQHLKIVDIFAENPHDNSAMTGLVPDFPLLIAFVAASILLAITPGPGVLYVVTRSVAEGRRSGLASVSGVAVGNFGNAIGASLGLAAIFTVFSSAFIIVKYAGAAYLIYLGIKAIRPAPEPRTTNRGIASKRVFREGVIVALLNPKTTLFFAAFLPQFMSADALPVVQPILLGALFVFVAAVTDSLYALTAAGFGRRLTRSASLQTVGRYGSGTCYIGLGMFAAMSDTGRAK